MKEKIILVFIIVCFSAGCKKNRTDENLINKTWVLDHIEDIQSKAVTPFPVGLNPIMIDFTDSSNVVTFKGVCNTGSGKYSYSVISMKINISDLTLTKVACIGIDWESYASQNMVNSYKYSINGNTLEIFTHGNYNLFFTRQ